jgi:hypothetical protein
MYNPKEVSKWWKLGEVDDLFENYRAKNNFTHTGRSLLPPPSYDETINIVVFIYYHKQNYYLQ